MDHCVLHYICSWLSDLIKASYECHKMSWKAHLDQNIEEVVVLNTIKSFAIVIKYYESFICSVSSIKSCSVKRMSIVPLFVLYPA